MKENHKGIIALIILLLILTISIIYMIAYPINPTQEEFGTKPIPQPVFNKTIPEPPKEETQQTITIEVLEK